MPAIEPRTFLLRCPKTGLMVQVHVTDPPGGTAQGLAYVGMHCNACGAWHFVNPKTGKLVSDEARAGAEVDVPGRT